MFITVVYHVYVPIATSLTVHCKLILMKGIKYCKVHFKKNTSTQTMASSSFHVFEKPKDLRSRSGAKTVTINLFNPLEEEVNVFWVGYDGNEVNYGSLCSGDSMIMDTFVSHPWILRKANNNAKIVALYVPDETTEDDFTVVAGETYYNAEEKKENIKAERVKSRMMKTITKTYDNNVNNEKDPPLKGLKSINVGGSVSVYFRNLSSTKVNLYWIDYEGNHLHYGEIQPGGVLGYGSGIKHAWTIKNEEGKVLRAAVVHENQPEIVVVDSTFTIISNTVESEFETSCHSIIEKYASSRMGIDKKGFEFEKSKDLVNELKQKLIKENKRFIDEEFLPESDWERAFDFYKEKVALFKNNASFGDAIQGSVGNCWLLQSMAGVALKNGYKDIFVLCDTIDPFIGLYSVTFYNNEEKYTVLLDDYLPVSYGQLVYAKSKDEGELWVPLVEKAFAKLAGGYPNLEAKSANCNPSKALAWMLGGKDKEIGWQKANSAGDKLIKESKFWPLVESLMDNPKSAVVCTSAENKDNNNLVGNNGLVSYHGYTIVEYKKFPTEGINLVKVRNTWGNTEWTGAFSDDSKEWDQYPNIKEQLNLEKTNDGVFWMTYEDFLKNFCVLWWNEF